MIKQSANELSGNYQFNGIDLIKFICAFLICIIHINPFQTDVGFNHINFWLQNCFCRIAVPFYFTAAGFLLFRKTDFNNLSYNRIKNYCFKLLRLLGTWTVLLFVGEKWQMWYLGALVVAVLILSALIKNTSLTIIVIIALILFVFGLLGDSYYGFVEPLKRYFIPRWIITGYDTLFSTTRNGVFFSLIFVLIGALFAKKRIIINNIVAVGGFALSIVAMFFEVYLLQRFSHPKDYNMFISLLPLVFFLFYLATHIELKNRPFYATLRVVGVLVFFTHLLVNYLVLLVMPIINSKLRIDLTNHQFIITMCITILLAIAIERLSKIERFHWLKYLYS